MSRALWAAQLLLGLAFSMAGLMKMHTPYEILAEEMSWVSHVPGPLVQGIGLLETLAALGLVLPGLLRIKPWLTPLAAGGLVLTMLGAAGLHIAIGEGVMIVPSLILGSIAAWICWGRLNNGLGPRDEVNLSGGL